jgi:hypothetical protein
MQKLDFMSEDGGAVGCFEGVEHPHRDGRYRYVPYRSYSHYAMQEALRYGSVPRCHYDFEDVRVSFAVRGCPEYGVLELYDFKSSEKDMP